MEYLSIEKGCRDYISSCWYHIKKGLKQGHEEINSKLNDDMKLKELTPIIGNRYVKIQEKNTRLKSFMSTDEAEEEYGNCNVLYIF